MGNLSIPISVQKLQKALHAKAKSEAGYRFYALYDRIYREDIPAYACAQCRSNKGAPGVDAPQRVPSSASWRADIASAKGRAITPGSINVFQP